MLPRQPSWSQLVPRCVQFLFKWPQVISLQISWRDPGAKLEHLTCKMNPSSKMASLQILLKLKMSCLHELSTLELIKLLFSKPRDPTAAAHHLNILMHASFNVFTTTTNGNPCSTAYYRSTNVVLPSIDEKTSGTTFC